MLRTIEKKRAIVIAVLAAVLLICSFASMALYDVRVREYFASSDTSFSRTVWMEGFKQFGKTWVPVWLMLLWLLTCRRVEPVLAGLVALVVVLPMVVGVKMSVNRIRPQQMVYISQGMEPEQIPRSNSSFPSGDTASIFAAVTALILMRGWRLALLVLPAAGVGVMRVVDLRHYPSDVFAGVAVGIIAGFIAVYIVENHPNLYPEQYLSRPWRMVTIALIVLLPFLASLTEGSSSIFRFLMPYWPIVLVVFCVNYFRFRRKKRYER
ncbi:MAG: phosphatase PAP2 family protein [Phycisphaerae bacterium]